MPVFSMCRCFVSKINEKDLDVAQVLLNIKRCNTVVRHLIERLDLHKLNLPPTKSISFDLTVQGESKSSRERSIDAIAQELATQLGLPCVCLWTVNADATFRLAATAGLNIGFSAFDNSVYLTLESELLATTNVGFEDAVAKNGFGPAELIIRDFSAASSPVEEHEWIMANRIQGFAGLPLVVRGETLGVVEFFSQQAISAELCVVLPMLQLSLTSLMASILKQPLRSEQMRTSPLSEREKEVIELLAQGQRDRDISEQLYISQRTVKFHVKNILKKMAVNTRVQAVFEATQRGWM